MKVTLVSVLCSIALLAEARNPYSAGAAAMPAGAMASYWTGTPYHFEKKRSPPPKKRQSSSLGFSSSSSSGGSSNNNAGKATGFINAYQEQFRNEVTTEVTASEAPAKIPVKTPAKKPAKEVKEKPKKPERKPEGKPAERPKKPERKPRRQLTSTQSEASTPEQVHRRPRAERARTAQALHVAPQRNAVRAPAAEIECPASLPSSLDSSSLSSSSSSSSCSYAQRCGPPMNEFLSCTKEQAIVATQRVNELFNTLWAAGETAALYAQAVHPESYYRILEPDEAGACAWIEGPLYDYLAQPGTFTSFVEKYTYNKATGAITAHVIEVGNVNGVQVSRKLKRQYITLRGCEYKLYTVTGENFLCL